MRIALDTRTIRHPQTGIGRSTERLCEALAAQFPNDQFLFISLKNQAPTRLAHFPNVEIHETSQDYQRHGSAEIWLNHGLIKTVERWRGDVLHGPAFLIPWRRTSFARVVTIMDMIAFRCPRNYPPGFRAYMKFITRRTAKSADAIIVPAQYVAGELAHFVKGAESKSRAVPLGPGLSEVESGEQFNSAELPKPPYILFVGKLERRKDLRTVLQAFTIAKQRDDIPHRLVIAGAADPRNKDAVGHLNRHPYRERITWIESPLSDAAMQALYRDADALVFASFCEGFGLPLVEAMRHGVPVIAANAATAPEICGNAALYFTPATPSDLAGQMRRLLSDESLATTLAAEARRRAEAFTWTRAAELTYDVYRSVVKKS